MLAYVDLADPGGMNTPSLGISPLANASRFSISSLWCLAGSKPQYLHHSVKLRLIERLVSSSFAASERDICKLIVRQILGNGLTDSHVNRLRRLAPASVNQSDGG